MELHIDEDKSSSSTAINGSSEAERTNGFSALTDEKEEQTVVNEDRDDCKKYTDSVPDAQECPLPMSLEPASTTYDIDEGLVQEGESQISPRVPSPMSITQTDKSDADVVSLVDIEASLEHIQSNGCGTVDIMPADSLQLTCDDILKESSSNLPPEESISTLNECFESSSVVENAVQPIEAVDNSVNCENQMECDKSGSVNDSQPEKENERRLSSYAILPGELTNQLIEGPSITLPPSELQSKSLAQSRREDSESVSKSVIPSPLHSENVAQPHSHITTDVQPLLKSSDAINLTTTDLSQTDASTSPQNASVQAAETNVETKTVVPESLSSQSKSNATSATTSSLSNNAPVKQKIKKTPHDFIFGKVLGEGSYSTVHLAKEVSTQKEYAIKVCDKKHLIRERKTHFVMREKEVLMKLNHPFFIKLAYTFQDPERLYYVLTYARNGELLTYLHKLSVFDVPCTRFYSAEIVLALEYLQSLGIVHRDLKPENILFGDDMHIKITDFGTSKVMESDVKAADGKETKRKNSFVGTAEYVSPEVLNNLPANYGSDIWALGCIIYQCLSSSPPFRCGNEYQTFQKIIKLDYEFPDGFNEDAKDLVQKLLVIDPNERLGMRQLEGMVELKNHRFFIGIDWENLSSTIPPKLLPYLPATGDNPEFWGGQEHRTGFDDQRLAEIITGQSIDCSQSPEIEMIPVKELQQMEDTERTEKMAKQKLENQFHPFVDDNLILRQGFVDKRKGLFARKRMLLLTEGPHLYYVDAHNKVLKGEIPWSKELRPEAKNFKIFFVHTPNRTYYLESRNPDAHLWVKQIQDVWKKYYTDSEKP